MSLKNNILFSVFFATTLMLTAPAGAAGKPAAKPAERTYIFTSFTYSRFGSADQLDMIKTLGKMAEHASKKTGYKVVFKNYPNGSYIKGFKNGEIDFGLISTEDVFTLKRMGIELEPLVLVSMKKKKGMRGCIYVRKDTYKSVKELAGAPVNLYGAGTFRGAYLLERKLLLDQGINKPLTDFFGPIYKIPFESSGFQALLLGKVEAVADADWNYMVFGSKLPGIQDIKPIVCTDEYPIMGVFMRKGIDKDVTAKFSEYLIKLYGDPTLGELRTIFVALNVRFEAPDPALMKRAYELFALGTKNGWFKEGEEFSKKMDKLKFGEKLEPKKKTYKQCKEQCNKNADKEKCMDLCMGN